MKYLLAILIGVALVASCAPKPESKIENALGRVVSCSDIKTNPNVTTGTKFKCLDDNSEIIFEAITGPALINVWGSWCPPCKEEMPYLRAVAATGKLAIIGVNIDEPNLKTPQNFVVKQGITWPNLFDSDGRSKPIFGIGVPVTWFMDEAGRITYRHIGVITSEKQLFDEVEKYLGIKL